jgi:hypothetical protein
MTPLTVHHRTPLVLWAFAAVWCGGVLLGTYVLWRDGPPDGATPLAAWAVLMLFWLTGIGLGTHAFSQPTVALRIEPDGRAEIVRRWPLARRVARLPASALSLRLQEDVDSDGDPYFRLRLHAGLHLEAPVSVAEGGREHCEAMRERLRLAGIADVDGR